MRLLAWIVLGLVVLEGGWMAFDGGRALAVGDYVTPRSGEYAGRLGPWSGVVSAVGIDPRSTLMKSIFLVYGVAWLGCAVFFVLEFRWAWWAMLILAVGALWYLPWGTLLGLVQVILLLMPPLRNPAAGG